MTGYWVHMDYDNDNDTTCWIADIYDSRPDFI